MSIIENFILKTNYDMRLKRSEQAKQLHITNKKTINNNL